MRYTSCGLVRVPTFNDCLSSPQHHRNPPPPHPTATSIRHLRAHHNNKHPSSAPHINVSRGGLHPRLPPPGPNRHLPPAGPPPHHHTTAAAAAADNCPRSPGRPTHTASNTLLLPRQSRPAPPPQENPRPPTPLRRAPQTRNRAPHRPQHPHARPHRRPQQTNLARLKGLHPPRRHPADPLPQPRPLLRRAHQPAPPRNRLGPPPPQPAHPNRRRDVGQGLLAAHRGRGRRPEERKAREKGKVVSHAQAKARYWKCAEYRDGVHEAEGVVEVWRGEEARCTRWWKEEVDTLLVTMLCDDCDDGEGPELRVIDTGSLFFDFLMYSTIDI